MQRDDDFIAGFRRMQEGFDELFSGLLEGRPRGARRAAADVYVIDEPPAVVIEIEAAGMDPERVHVELDGRGLLVRGERRRRPGRRRVYHHAEIEWGPFERRIQLGVAVDGEAAQARYEAGLLVITLPLARAQSQRRVPIVVRATG